MIAGPAANFAKLWSARGKATALGGRGKGDSAEALIFAEIAARIKAAFPPLSQSGGSIATELYSAAHENDV
jgi:hypothetical protein